MRQRSMLKDPPKPKPDPIIHAYCADVWARWQDAERAAGTWTPELEKLSPRRLPPDGDVVAPVRATQQR